MCAHNFHEHTLHVYTCVRIYMHIYIHVCMYAGICVCGYTTARESNSTSFAEHIYTYETCKYMKLFSLWNHFLKLCVSICKPFIYFLSIPLPLMSIKDRFHNPLLIHFLESYGSLKVDAYMYVHTLAEMFMCVLWILFPWLFSLFMYWLILHPLSSFLRLLSILYFIPSHGLLCIMTLGNSFSFFLTFKSFFLYIMDSFCLSRWLVLHPALIFIA